MAVVALTALIAAGCSSLGSGGGVDPDVARGRQQLVDAFDAAWIRVVASGKDREILSRQPPAKPGAASSYYVTLADCLPSPEVAPFPEKPVGLFKQILDSGKIRRVTQKTTDTANDTSFWFSSVSDLQLEAMLQEIGRHYGKTIAVEEVVLPPGPAPTTSLVADGKADFVDQLNAVGGETQGMRRRASRRYTCTMSAISQYIHIPEKSPLAAEINTVDDLHKRKDLRICTGPLATQTTKAFFPQHKVSTKYMNDLTGCVRDAEAGKADLIINPLPTFEVAGIEGFKEVNTWIVTGTPLWVAREDVTCPSDDNPRTEDQCFRTE